MNRIVQIGGSIAYNLLVPVFRIISGRSERTRVLVIREGKILLIKNIIGNNRWTLPGGGLHKAESPVAGAVRELQEETGLVFSQTALTAAGVHDYEYRGIKFRYHLFVVQDTTTQSLKTQAHEVLAAEWVARNDLKNYTLSSVVTTAAEHWPK